MSSYPPEWDTLEEEQPVIEAEPQPPQETPGRQAPPPRTRQRQPERRRRSDKLSKLALGISVLALILAAIALFFALKPEPEPEEEPPAPPVVEEPITFKFGDRVLTPLEGMPLNPYDRDSFSLDEKGRITYEKDGKRARTGVDVSTYQKEIDWQAVAADGIDFAILRVGGRGYGPEGNLYWDKYFEQNLAGATAAGLDVGIYFFSQAITPQEAEEEAWQVLSHLRGRPLTYPIVFDWETISGTPARTDYLDTATLTACAKTFCECIAIAGYQPMVYFNATNGLLDYDLSQLTAYPFWYAYYLPSTSTDPWLYYDFRMWQYTSSGTVAGIPGRADMNICFYPYGKTAG